MRFSVFVIGGFQRQAIHQISISLSGVQSLAKAHREVALHLPYLGTLAGFLLLVLTVGIRRSLRFPLPLLLLSAVHGVGSAAR